MLGDPLAAYAQGSLPQIRNQLAVEGIAIVPAQLGVHGEIGVIVLGSNRTGFPEKTESLLLSVAANEATIGLQEARLLSEQKRISAELNAENQMWPVLTEVEIDRARPYGRVRRVEIGEILYRPGEVGRPCFILLSVSLEIVQPTINGERLVTILRPGMFTGEAGSIAGQRTVVQARVIQAGEILEVRPEDLRTLVAHDASLSEILLRAFMLRRLMLIDRQLGNVVVVGSRHSADTLRLREFLSRNGHPFSYIDLDMDDAYRNLLDRFGIAVSEIPIVIGNDGTMVLRKNFRQIGRGALQPSQRCLGTIGRGHDGLCELVRDRGNQFSQHAHPIDMCQIGAECGICAGRLGEVSMELRKIVFWPRRGDILQINARVVEHKIRVSKVQAGATDGIAEIRFVSHVALKRYRSTPRPYYLSDNPLRSGLIRCIVDYNRCTQFPEAACYRGTDPI
jgi:CRP-like cAMP-binding protein